jgi:hypothetical protein
MSAAAASLTLSSLLQDEQLQQSRCGSAATSASPSSCRCAQNSIAFSLLSVGLTNFAQQHHGLMLQYETLVSRNRLVRQSQPTHKEGAAAML